MPTVHSASVGLSMKDVTSAIIAGGEALVAKQLAKKERRSVEEHKSLDVTRLAVNRRLAELGCCHNDRTASLDMSRDWL
jgi:hypothetical protein